MVQYTSLGHPDCDWPRRRETVSDGGDQLAIVHITLDVLSQMRKGHLSRQVWAKTKLFRGQKGVLIELVVLPKLSSFLDDLA